VKKPSTVEASLATSLTDAVAELIESGATEQEIADRLAAGFTAAMPTVGAFLATELHKKARSHLAHYRRAQRDFDKSLRSTWGRSFKLLRMLVEATREAVAEENALCRPSAVKQKDHVFDALVRLNVRACLVFEEILCLMGGGFASGAMARWRTLHEIAVVAFLIRDHGQDLAERYLHHAEIETCRAANQYQEHCDRLGRPRLSKRDLARHQKNRDRLTKRFGKEYVTDWGWAAKVIGSPRPAFTDLEAAVDLSYIRPFFKLACYPNHAGAKGLRFDMGKPLDPPGEEVLLTGSSNVGFFDPGYCASKTLVQVTATLLLRGLPTMRTLSIVSTLHHLAGEIEAELAAAEALVDLDMLARISRPRKRPGGKKRSRPKASKAATG
jgi:hypothetical protein